MAAGAPNTAERMRAQLQTQLGTQTEVPVDLLRGLAQARERQVSNDVEEISSEVGLPAMDSDKIGEFLRHAAVPSFARPDLPVQFHAAARPSIDVTYADKTAEIIDLARQLIRIPSVTACPNERLEEVRRAGSLVYDYLKDGGADVRYFDGKYPAVFARFPGATPGTTVLSGHFDVVEPEPDEGQFSPRIEGDYLWGRGASDMKTVVATYLVWMKDLLRSGKTSPPSPCCWSATKRTANPRPWERRMYSKLLQRRKRLHAATPDRWRADG